MLSFLKSLFITKMAPTTQKRKDIVNNQITNVTNEDKEPGVVYIGHVPHGFYEKQIRQYFSQFGTVLAVKLSRSKRTGGSKGYAFIKFRYAAVAKTVAETCHNYLFFNKLLKCEYKPLSEVHEDAFYNYRWKANNKSKRLHNSAKDEEKIIENLQRSTRHTQSKLNKLKELGIDLKLEDVMDVPEKAIRKPKPKTAVIEATGGVVEPEAVAKNSKRKTKAKTAVTEEVDVQENAKKKQKTKTVVTEEVDAAGNAKKKQKIKTAVAENANDAVKAATSLMSAKSPVSAKVLKRAVKAPAVVKGRKPKPPPAKRVKRE